MSLLVRIKIIVFVALSILSPYLFAKSTIVIESVSNPKSVSFKKAVNPDLKSPKSESNSKSASAPEEFERFVLVKGKNWGDNPDIILHNKHFAVWKNRCDIKIKPEWSNTNYLMFKVPKEIEDGVFWFKVIEKKAYSPSTPVGVPVVLGMDINLVKRSLSIFGTNLCFDDSLALIQLKGNGKEIYMNPNKQTFFKLDIDVPSEIAPGKYDIAVRNGDYNQKYWVKAGTIQVK